MEERESTVKVRSTRSEALEAVMTSSGESRSGYWYESQ